MTAQPAPQEARRSRGDRQREAIVNAVRELLQERPFADLSVSTISERAGIARSGAAFLSGGWAFQKGVPVEA